MPLINEALCRAAAPAPLADGKPVRINHVDDKTPGFVLRVSSNGARAFYFYYRDKLLKKPVWVKLGDYHQQAFNVDAGRAAAIVMLAKVSGPSPIDLRKERMQAARTAVAGGKSFAAAVDEYLADCALRLRAPHAIESCLRRPVKAWGALACADITDDMVAELLRPLAAAHPSRVNHIQTALHTFFGWCRQPGRKYVPANIMAGIDRFGIAQGPRQHTLTEDEIRILWRGLGDPAILAAAKCPRSAALALKLTLATMLRSGEVVQGQRSELGDDNGPIWTIPAERVKLKRDIVQPLNSLAQEIIAEALADAGQEVMFPGRSEDGMLAQQSLSHILTGTKDGKYPGLCKLLGVRPFRAHDLRRTGSTLCKRRGQHLANIKDHVEKTMDHLTVSSISAVYDTHDYLPEKREVLNLLDRELRRIIGQPAALKLAA